MPVVSGSPKGHPWGRLGAAHGGKLGVVVVIVCVADV